MIVFVGGGSSAGQGRCRGGSKGLANGLTSAGLPLSKAIEREVKSMKMPPLVVCLTAIGFFALSPVSRGAPPGSGGSHSSGGRFHGGFAGRGAGRVSNMGGHSAMEPHFPRASGFARGLGSRDVPLRAGRGHEIAVLLHDDGRFRDHHFRHHGDSRDDDERHHRHFFNDFDFVAFGLPDWWYPGYGYVDGEYSDEDGYSDEDADSDSAPAYGDQYWQDLAMKVQWALSQRGYYHGPIDGVIGPDGTRAIRAFQEAQGLPATGRIDPNLLTALKLPLPQVSLRPK